MSELKNVYSSESTISNAPYDSNNQYVNFPPLMNDGRSLVAGWQLENDDFAKYKKYSGITSNWKYRRYLTHNAKSIMQAQVEETFNDVGYYQRFNEQPVTNIMKPSDYVMKRVPM
jgi:hypothetical protein